MAAFDFDIESLFMYILRCGSIYTGTGNMRLDKFLCDCHMGTRSQVKREIRNGLVTVNDIKALRPEQPVDEKTDRICYRGQLCIYEKYVYYMMHKPAGVVSATEDKRERTVLDLMRDEKMEDLFPVGRLDKDAEGLLLITNDGALAHALLSPARHVEKEYECHLAHPLSEEQAGRLERGVDIGDQELTKPAAVRRLDDKRILLTITEGRFHQVKRMLHAVGNEVQYLKRLRMGALELDRELPKGSFRRLTEEETERLHHDRGGYL